MTEGLAVERDGPIATIRFDRPQALNAFTPEMSVALATELRSLGNDPAVAVVILTGKGQAFSAGADLKSLAAPGRLGRSEEVGAERVRAAGRRIEELRELPKPTIAAVNGVVAGFALGLVFACDVAIAGASARFGVTFSRIGYVPDAGVSWFLPRLAGLSRAKELFFRGEVIDAPEAARLGLVSRVVPDERLRDETLSVAREIAARPATALRLGKTLLNRSAAADFATAIELEARAQGFLGTTAEHQSAVREFLTREKR